MDKTQRTPEGKGTLEERVARAEMDFDTLIQQATPEGIAPYQELPSGNYLHNPAKKQVKSGAEMASKLIANASNGAAAWEKGMQNPSRDPIEAALDAAPKWRNNMQKAITEGRFEKGLRKTNSAELKAIAQRVGGQALVTGLQARTDKVNRAMNELQPKLQAVSDTVQAMPNATEADRDARILAAVKLMRKVKTS